MRELSALDPDDIPGLWDVYKKAIPRGIEKIVGVFPDVGGRFEVNYYHETIAQNAARFKAFLDANFNGSAKLYEFARAVGRFHFEDDAFRTWEDYCRVERVLYALQFATGGEVNYTETREVVGRIEAEFRPAFTLDAFAYKADVEINGQKFTVQGFKNGNTKIKGLTDENRAKINELHTYAMKRR
jgi:hypothetical protein